MFEWKRARIQEQKADTPTHLPCKKSISIPLPNIVNEWFVRLGRVEQVPFNYLVADPNLLPQESIQFFCVDPQWAQLLLRGAFSIGDIASGDTQIDDLLFAEIPIPAMLSGFFLRSPVVSGWPHLLVQGFDTAPPANSHPSFESGVQHLTQYRYMLEKILCCVSLKDLSKALKSTFTLKLYTTVLTTRLRTKAKYSIALLFETFAR